MKNKPTKELTPKQQLAEGAKAVRAAAKAEREKGKQAKSADIGTKGELAVIPPIKICKDDIQKILDRRVVMGKNHASLTINPDTTPGEYLAIFDNIIGLGEKVQFLIGDVINEGEKLACFGDKYAAAMASTGRPISTLKHYASAARNIPQNLRSLHSAITYSHCAEVVKIPAMEDKKELLTAAADAARQGSPMTVKEIRERAAKLIPKKKKKKKAEVDAGADASEEEKVAIEEICAELDKALSVMARVEFLAGIKAEDVDGIVTRCDEIEKLASVLRK